MGGWTRSVFPLALAICLPSMLRAQAWLPEKGTFGASILYSDIFDTKHYLPDGEEFDAGHMRSYSLGLTLSYSPTDRVLITAGVPYVRAEYHGALPHPVEVDDGDYHGTFTDLRLELHYQVALEPVAFAPYIAIVEPTHNYPALGHAAPGRNLREQWIGFFLGKSLDVWIPRTYIQARYTFAFVEEVVGIGHDRSNLDLEVGHFILPQWSVRGVLFWQRTHGGIDVPIPVSHPLFEYHDQLAAERFLNVGLGTAYAVSNGTSLFALFNTSLRGENSHKLGRGIHVGFGYSFAPR